MWLVLSTDDKQQVHLWQCRNKDDMEHIYRWVLKLWNVKEHSHSVVYSIEYSTIKYKLKEGEDFPDNKWYTVQWKLNIQSSTNTIKKPCNVSLFGMWANKTWTCKKQATMRSTWTSTPHRHLFYTDMLSKNKTSAFVFWNTKIPHAQSIFKLLITLERLSQCYYCI